MALVSSDGRLQTCIQPVAYRVHWDLVGAAARNSGLVTGRVELTGVVTHLDLFLALHAKKGIVDIEDVSLAVGGAPTKAKWVWSAVATEDAGVVDVSPDVLRHHHDTGDQLVVTLSFSVRLAARGGMQGLYVARTGSLNGGAATTAATAATFPVLFATQFQPTSARRAFPCVDEPASKAEFQVSVAAPPGWVVLGNTAPEPSTPDEPNPMVLEPGGPGGPGGPAVHVTTFQPTPRMSTYLLAVVAAAPGQLACAATRTVMPAPRGSGPPVRDPVAVRVWCRPSADAAQVATTAAGVAAAALVFMEALTALPFTLRKLDLVSVDAFDSGAMENWGLMLFRPSAVLVRPDAQPQEREVVVSTVAHEVAHQWFGNLVTCAWWNELWLNEGLATLCAAWFQACGYNLDSLTPAASLCRAMDPGNPVWVQWVLNEGHSALHDRAVAGGPPVVTDEDIAAQFDGATYNRSASVLRMLVLVQGPQAAVTALRAYLRAASTDPGHHGCATEGMLWAYLDPQQQLGPQWMRVGGLVAVKAGQPSDISTTAMDGTMVTLPLVGSTAMGMGKVASVTENLHGAMPAVIVHGPDWHPVPATVALQLALQLHSHGTAAAMVVDAEAALETSSTPPNALAAAVQVLRVAAGGRTAGANPAVAQFAGSTLRHVSELCGTTKTDAAETAAGAGPAPEGRGAKPKKATPPNLADLVAARKAAKGAAGGPTKSPWPRATVLQAVWAAPADVLLQAFKDVLAAGVAEEWLPGIMAWVLGARVAEAQVQAQAQGGSSGFAAGAVSFDAALEAVSPMYVSEFMNGAADHGANGSVLWTWLEKQQGWKTLDHFAVGKFGVRTVAEVIVHAAMEAAVAEASHGGPAAYNTGRACAHALKTMRGGGALSRYEIETLVATVMRQRASEAAITTRVCPLVADGDQRKMAAK